MKVFILISVVAFLSSDKDPAVWALLLWYIHNDLYSDSRGERSRARDATSSVCVCVI